MSKNIMAIACAYIFVSFALAGCDSKPLGLAERFDRASQHEIQAPSYKQSKSAAESAYARRQEIRKEIASLKDHPWAGEYFKGDGLGMNILLSIAPKAGYVYEWYGCEGLYVRDYGTVDWKDGEIRPTHVYKNTVSDGFDCIADALIPVDWGDRKYLISPDELIDFCNDVNAGREPRRSEYGERHGRYGMSFLRLGDGEKKVVGQPMVPKDYRPYLLDEPITASIIAVGEPVKNSDRNVEKWTTAVTINAGKKQGMLPGMQLYLIDPNRNVKALGIYGIDSLRISRVEDDKAEAVLEQIDNQNGASYLKVGWKVSTRPPQPTPQEEKRGSTGS
jgi:hypothetical protein